MDDDDDRNNKDKKGKSLLLSSIPIAVVLATMVALTPLLSQQQNVLAQTNATQPATTRMSPSTASQAPGSAFSLSRASVPIDIPLSKGYVNGNEVFFITTNMKGLKVIRERRKVDRILQEISQLQKKGELNKLQQQQAL